MKCAQKRRFSRFFSVASYLGLIGYFYIASFMNPIADANPWVIASIKALPILAFAKGLWQQNQRTLLWLCFVLLIYFVFTVATWQPQSWVMMLFIVVLFGSLVMHIRWHQRR